MSRSVQRPQAQRTNVKLVTIRKYHVVRAGRVRMRRQLCPCALERHSVAVDVIGMRVRIDDVGDRDSLIDRPLYECLGRVGWIDQHALSGVAIREQVSEIAVAARADLFKNQLHNRGGRLEPALHLVYASGVRGWFLLAFGFVAACAPARTVQQPPIIQPGAPGEAPRRITAAQATDQRAVGHTFADVIFMQSMIRHHYQALEMTSLREGRSTNETMRLLMLRIQLSQEDEIGAMGAWLKARGQIVPDEHAGHGLAATLMPGMLSIEEMEQLKAATDGEFDRLFLEFMIKHHEGALIMVEDLFATPGAAQDSEVFAFASDVVDDQRAEIGRMAAMLKELQK